MTHTTSNGERTIQTIIIAWHRKDSQNKITGTNIASDGFAKNLRAFSFAIDTIITQKSPTSISEIEQGYNLFCYFHCNQLKIKQVCNFIHIAITCSIRCNIKIK